MPSGTELDRPSSLMAISHICRQYGFHHGAAVDVGLVFVDEWETICNVFCTVCYSSLLSLKLTLITAPPKTLILNWPVDG